MLPDRKSNPGPLTYESGALPIALRGPADLVGSCHLFHHKIYGILYSVRSAFSLFYFHVSGGGLAFVFHAEKLRDVSLPYEIILGVVFAF